MMRIGRSLRVRLGMVAGALTIVSGGLAMVASSSASGDTPSLPAPVPAVAVNTSPSVADVPLSDLAQVPNQEPPMPASRPEPAGLVNPNLVTEDAPAGTADIVQPAGPTNLP
jgi:hypothetical protein